MKKRKNYSIDSSLVPSKSIDGPCPWVWQLPTQKLDFRRWQYELGIAENPTKDRGLLLNQFRDAIWQLRHEQSSASLIALYHNGFSEFIRFIDETAAKINSISDISQDGLLHFVRWVKNQKVDNTQQNISYATARRRYSSVKSILMFYSRSGLFNKRLLPINPFPNANRQKQGVTPYNKPEMTQIMRALSSEYRRIKEDSSALSLRQQLAVLQLLIIAKTGINPTPLGEASRDCLEPHPLQPDKSMVLITRKRRGMSTNSIGERIPAEVESLSNLPTSVAAVIHEGLRLTESLVDNAPIEHKNRLWIYKPSKQGKVTAFKGTYLNGASKDVSRIHGLTSDLGEPLIISPQRLRKTFSNRIWQLTDGDVWKTARILGNTPQVTDKHYLDVTPDMERNHSFVGKAFELKVRGTENSSEAITGFAEAASISETQAKLVLSGNNNTGVARCSAPTSGKFAPNNGEPCTRFLDCFRCPNQIVLESDLYRLYSFYWLILKQRSAIGRKRWKKLYGWVVREIDNGIAKNFSKDAIGEAKEQALTKPHPMWANRIILGEADE